MSHMDLFGEGFNLSAVNNGKFTILSPSGEHRTFRLMRQKADDKFMPGQLIVSLLIGSDNELSYRGFGNVEADATGKPLGIKVWHSRMGEQKGKLPVMAAMLFSLITQGKASEWFMRGCTIMNSSHCFRCGRTLTTPDSIERGIGPECATKM